MKLVLNICCLLFATALLGQSGTTLEEYRYLTKGYAYQSEMGLDHSKEGYHFQQLYQNDQLAFVGMYKLNDPAPRAILAILDRHKTQAKYLCLPNATASEDILEQYRKDRNNLLASTAARQQFEEASRLLLFQSMSQPAYAQAQPTAAPPSKKLYSRTTGAPVATQVEASEAEITMTSKGIPIKPAYELPKAYGPTSPETAPANYQPAQPMDTPAEAAPAASPTINQRVQTQIEGQLENRSLLQPLLVERQHRSRGKVVVKVCVDGEGDVISAKFTQRGSNTFDKELKKIAVESARKAKFGQSPFQEECGYIAYSFQ